MNPTTFNLARLARRGLTTHAPTATATARTRACVHRPFLPRTLRAIVLGTAPAARRFVGTSSSRNKGISPDSEDPAPKMPEEVEVPMTAAPLRDAEYHELADEYLDKALSKFEEIQEQRSEVDVEFSAGVLTLTFPPLGTYVINKQPPNKQIWLSSPVSGPKRYDYVIIGDGQNAKEGTAMGDWIYLRDGSSMADLFREELEVDIGISEA